jgi:hypothetical protein
MSEIRKGPPNLRRASTCERCKFSILLMSNHICSCEKYRENVKLGEVCDSFEEFINEKKSFRQGNRKS